MMPTVSEQVELVQVLLYLSDRQERVMQYLNNKMYSGAISAFFLPYKNHKAVTMTKKLIDMNNFIHIKPLRAIFSLEQILTEKEHDLNEWAISVKEFIADSNFHTFYLNQEGYYNWILDNLSQCDFDTWIATFSLIASSSCDSPFDFLILLMFSLSIICASLFLMAQFYMQKSRCHKQRILTSAYLRAFQRHIKKYI